MSELMERESTEVQVVDNSPARFIEMAIANNADIDKLEKLMALNERHEANLAKKAFVKALVEFQYDCPTIIKAKDGHNCKYAPISAIITAIKEPLSKHGLSYRFEQLEVDGQIQITCHITHKDGHSEATAMKAGSDTSGGKNVIQAYGSAVTYLQRYTLTGALGIATADEDTDGNTGEIIDYKERAEKWQSAFNKLVAHNAVVREFYEEIYIVKEKLANGDVLGAKTDLSECMASEQKDLLYARAEKHGAIISSKEKTAMKNYSTEERNAA
jgi:hypothetical protein